MLNLWEVLDTAKASLPSFGDVDMKRYPPVALANSDTFGLTVNVLDVRSQMADVRSQVSTMVSQMKKMEESQRLLTERLNHHGTAKQSSWPSWPTISSVSARSTAVDLAAPPAIHLSAPASVSGSVRSNQSALPPPSSATYASALASSTDRPAVDSDGFTLVGGRRSSPARKTIRSKKTVTDNCKLHPMSRRFTAFVERLLFDTSADDLSEFLEAAGVIKPTCKRLEAKNGRQFKTAAFMVSCDAGSKDIFYDESI